MNINALVMEFLGTFLLLLVVSLSGGNALAVGAILMAMVYVGANVSGGHYNPAVTLGLLLRRSITAMQAAAYMVFQTLGAVLAAVVYWLLRGRFIVVAPGTRVGIPSLFLVEMLFTMALVFTVLHVATDEKSKGNQYFGLAIGLVLTACIYAGGQISGGIYNPAIALGTGLVDFKHLFSRFIVIAVYIIAELVGALLAAIAYKRTQS